MRQLRTFGSEVTEASSPARGNSDQGSRRSRTDPGHWVVLEVSDLSLGGAQERQDLPIIYLYSPVNIVGMNAKLTGFRPIPDGLIRLQGVSVTK